MRSAANAAVDHFEVHQGTHILQVRTYMLTISCNKIDNDNYVCTNISGINVETFVTVVGWFRDGGRCGWKVPVHIRDRVDLPRTFTGESLHFS